MTPKELFEVTNNWPWPSDHLPAVSRVDFGDSSVKVGTLNLLKKGFDDNRLQTSQGLGPQLASRFLEPLHSTRPDARVAVKPSAVKETGTLPRQRPERTNWKFSEIQAKDGWDINQIRQDAQATFIEKRLRSREVNLLGLNEVSSIQSKSLIEIAKRNDFLAIVTPSKRNARDTVTGQVETDLLDNGVILINAKKFEIVEDVKVSGYIDPKTNRPNKHITTVRLKEKATGREFYFTNTHADFWEIGSLSRHQDTLDPNLDQIIVGDMNAASKKVHQALRDPSGQLSVNYGNNTPAHVGFSKGNKGFVVDYDQVFVRTKSSQTLVREADDIHDWFVDYATVYRDSFDSAAKTTRLNNGS